MSAPVARPPRTAPKPPPAGAARWSRMYLDAKHLPRKSDTDVPVDENGYRTAHVRWWCRGHVDDRLETGRTVRRSCPTEVWRFPDDVADTFCPLHGAALQPDGPVKRPMPWADLLRAGRRPGYPLVALAGLAAAGQGLHDAATSVAEVAPAVPLAWAGAYLGVRWWQTRDAENSLPPRLDKGQRSGREWRKILRRSRLAGYLAAGSGAWLTAAAAVDPHTAVGAAVWFALPPLWALGAAPWWRYLADLRNRKPEPAPEPVTEEAEPVSDPYPPEAHQDVADWETTVATGAGLSGTWVDVATWKADPGGRRMVVRSKGAITDERLKMALPLIAAAFQVKQSAIGWVAEYEGSPRSALILVQPNSYLDNEVPWKPTGLMPIDNAVAHVGTQLDGNDLQTRLWTPGWGAPSRSIYGTKGSGKTEAVRLMMLGQLLALVDTPAGPRRLVAPFLHDPKLGKDFGAFRRQVCGFSTDQATLHMIVDALIREMDRRYDSLSTYTWRDHKGRLQEGEQPFDPTVHGPIISVWIDEFHEPSRDASLMAKLDPMARKMRAAGIEFNVATHMTTLSDTGSQAFRDMVAEEVFLFRTTSGLTSLATGGQLTGDPRLLPRVPGSLYFAAGEQNTIRSRFAYVPRNDLYDMLYDDNNVSKTLPVEWPAETLEAFGPEFVAWMRECQNRVPGSSQPSAPKGYVPGGPAASSEDALSRDALRRILFEADGPITRKAIEKHPLWAFGVTSTLTAALRFWQDAKPPWVVKQGAGPSSTFELAPWAREQLSAVEGEARQVAESERPSGDDQLALM